MRFPASSFLEEFTKTLRLLLDHPVIDKTGITGRFNIRIQFSPMGAEPFDSDPARPPSLFTALQEQVGLKLEPAKGSVETLVIDCIEKPAAN